MLAWRSTRTESMSTPEGSKKFIAIGWIGPATTVVEASSGSMAVSEAYFARLIGVPYIAVMSRATSPAKIALIEREGGRCRGAWTSVSASRH